MRKCKGFIGIILISMACIWTSCLFDGGGDKITGNYRLEWIDVPEDQYLSAVDRNGFSLQLIEPYVFAVDHNDHYIIAKQHARGDHRTTSYYIIDIKNHRDSVYGPFEKYQFDSLRQQFKITDIQFDQTYDD